MNESHPDAKQFISSLKVKPSKDSRDASLQALIDSIEGPASTDLSQAFAFESASRYRRDKAAQYLEERGRSLVREAKRIFTQIIGPGCEFQFHYNGYMIEHHTKPESVKPYLSFTVFSKGWEIRKNFYPRKPSHIEQMARKVKATIDMLNGLNIE